MSKVMIEVENLSKLYTLYRNPKDRLFDLIRFNKKGEEFYALNDVSFQAFEGEVIGFIGVNGSGKSTLSNIIAGITPRTSGTLNVYGETALIAVSAGLNNELSGRENIELKLLMLGFTKRKIRELEPGIIEFAELEQFIDQPVKSYSSGMKSRLGFAISVNVDPDILIIDEALSVGDKAFAEKSLKKMNEFKSKGKTMIFVSHSLGQMKQFCTKILWLEFGKIKMYGDVDEVLKEYEIFLDVWRTLDSDEKKSYQSSGNLPLRNIKEEKKINEYIKPTSFLCHLNNKPIFYWSDDKTSDGEKLKYSVYYSDRVYVNENNQKYYLLKKDFTEPIGWFKESDLTRHLFVNIPDYYSECFVKPDAQFFLYPWGGKNQVVQIEDEYSEKKQYKVTESCLVGNNTWYHVELFGWAHESSLIINNKM